MKTHTQVNLVKGSQRYTCWVPSHKVKMGSVLELEETRINEKNLEEKYYDGGWEVVGVGKTMDTAYVLERERDFKRTRGASDI